MFGMCDYYISSTILGSKKFCNSIESRSIENKIDIYIFDWNNQIRSESDNCNLNKLPEDMEYILSEHTLVLKKQEKYTVYVDINNYEISTTESVYKITFEFNNTEAYDFMIIFENTATKITFE